MPEKALSDLVQELAQRMQRSNLSLATAESCTGGGIGYCLTSVAGSSTWYLGGFITYSNSAKIRDLKVKPSTLDSLGAVSEEVAEQMAAGCLQRSESDLAVSVTGIAGPDGGTPDKPVGTVCFGWAHRSGTYSETKVFGGDRAAVRYQTIEHALKQALTFLDEFVV